MVDDTLDAGKGLNPLSSGKSGQTSDWDGVATKVAVLIPYQQGSLFRL